MGVSRSLRLASRLLARIPCRLGLGSIPLSLDARGLRVHRRVLGLSAGDRGILFAPAYIPPAVYAVPTYVYTPTVVVRSECMFGAFFCRRGWGCYYFGDYFAPHYASIGFVAWSGHVSASITIGAWHDPLFAYYHCGHRSDPYWRAGVFDLYAGRYRGVYARPPVTLVQQKTVINNITKNTTINKTTNVNSNNVTMLTSLNDANTSTASAKSLTKVSDGERQTQQQQAKNFREAADRRASTETTLAAKPGAGGRTGGPRTGTLDVVGSTVKPRAPIKDPGVGTGTGTAAGNATTPPNPKPAVLGKKDPVTGTGSGYTEGRVADDRWRGPEIEAANGNEAGSDQRSRLGSPTTRSRTR